MRRLALALVMLLVAPSAGAEDAWFGAGIGSQGCGKYVEFRRVPNKHFDDLVGSWFYGFLTARNYYGKQPQIKEGLDQSTVLAYLDKYCRDAPLASISVGALELVKTFEK